MHDQNCGCADEATGAEVAAGGDAVQRDRLRLLNAALDRATRANRPIIISRLLLPPAPSQDSGRPSHLTGDPALLSALQPLVSPPSSYGPLFDPQHLQAIATLLA